MEPTIFIALVSLITHGIWWFTYRSHNKDSTSHSEKFDQISKDIERVEFTVDAAINLMVERLESHSISMNAHEKAVPRIGSLEGDFKHVSASIDEIKILIAELRDMQRRAGAN